MATLIDNETKEVDNSVEARLRERIPFFAENPSFFKNTASPILVQGLVQSGKTKVIIGMSIFNVLVLKMPTIIIIRNYIADYEQIKRAFESELFADFNVSVLYAGEGITHKSFFQTDVSITICIDNHTPMKKISNTYEEFCKENNTKVPYSLIVDEADMIGYKKKDDRTRIMAFRKLKDNAARYIGVTATTFDMILMDNELDNKSIYKVPVHPNYKGLDHPDFSVIEKEPTFEFRSEDKALTSDMEKFYLELLKEPRPKEQPVICLQMTGVWIKDQVETSKALVGHPTLRQMAVVVYNGKGVNIFLPKQTNLPIDKRSCFVKNGHIGKALQYIKDLCGDMIGHIVIIAGAIVGRGLNISSTDYKWHLTHQICQVSKIATCSDVTQSCRLFGIYDDTIPIKLYCTTKEKDALIKSHRLQKRLMEAGEKMEETMIMKDLVAITPIHKDLVPARKLTNKITPRPNFLLVETEEEQYSDNPTIITKRKKASSVDGEPRATTKRRLVEPIEDGEIISVVVSGLTPKVLEVVNDVIKHMSDKPNEWTVRTSVFEAIVGPGMEKSRLNKLEFNLRTSYLKEKGYVKTNDETVEGLLMKKIGKKWYIRYNTK